MSTFVLPVAEIVLPMCERQDGLARTVYRAARERRPGLAHYYIQGAHVSDAISDRVGKNRAKQDMTIIRLSDIPACQLQQFVQQPTSL